TFGSKQPEEKLPSVSTMLSVTSVRVTPVYDADASSSFCPFGQVMFDGGGLTVSDPTTLPFLPELKVPLALTGPLRVVLFWALGLAPPPLTQTQVAVPCAVSV